MPPLEPGSVEIEKTRTPSGHVVSTVELSSREVRFETIVFAPGWPATGDVICSKRSTDLPEARLAHRAFVVRFSAGGDEEDPNWVFRMMGLQPRRWPSTVARKPRSEEHRGGSGQAKPLDSRRGRGADVS
jgi:hypothetical protein